MMKYGKTRRINVEKNHTFNDEQGITGGGMSVLFMEKAVLQIEMLTNETQSKVDVMI